MKQNDFEKLIIKALYSNDNVCSKVLPELRENWFSDIDCRMIAKDIIDFNTKFGRMPNVIETSRLITDDTVHTTFQNCIALPDDEVNTDFLLDDIQEFVRKKMAYNVSEDIVKWTMQGIAPKCSFADALSDAETFTFDTSIGFDFFGDPRRLYEDANTKERIFKTGVKTLDDMLMGGLHENSLNLIMSSTNVRKDFDNEFLDNQFGIEWLQGSLHYI